MTFKEIIGSLTILLLICSYAPYLYSIAKNQTKPHLFSWLVWTLLMGIGFAIQIHEGAGAGAWLTACATCVCALITVVAIFHGEKNITHSDWMSLCGALAAIPLWLMTHDPTASVILISLIDGLGFYPTIRKSWQQPWDENSLLYVFGAAGALLSVFAMDHVTFNTSFYPAAMCVMQAGFAMFLWIRRWKLKSRTRLIKS